MKNVYIVYTEEYGEVEGAFNEEGELIGMWSCNDASWRDEYFSGFMEELGIKTHTFSNTPKAKYNELMEKLLTEAKSIWGSWDEDEEE